MQKEETIGILMRGIRIDGFFLAREKRDAIIADAFYYYRYPQGTNTRRPFGRRTLFDAAEIAMFQAAAQGLLLTSLS